MSSLWLSDQRHVYLNSFCFGYRQDGSFDDLYLAYMLRSHASRAKIALLAQGISRYNISKKKMMDIAVPYPSVVEQHMIGSLFADVDNLITLRQRERLPMQKMPKAVSLRLRHLLKTTLNSPSLVIPLLATSAYRRS